MTDTRTIQQKADPAYLQEGDLVMLSCHVSLANKKAHPDCGRIGKITSIKGKGGEDHFIVQIENDDLVGSAKFLILPRKMFLPIAESWVEVFERRAKRTAWRLSKSGKQIFDGMGWPYLPATMGELG